MEHVLSERVFDVPMTAQRYLEIGRAGASCFDLYRVTYKGSYLAKDGLRAICVFNAPDAEALRNVARDLAMPARAVWSGTYHHPPATADMAPDGRQTVVVERCFPEPETLDNLQSREDARAWCLDAYGVTFLKTYFSLDRRRMVCVYAAPDAEAVRRVQDTTGLPYDRAWAADVLGWQAAPS